MNKYGQILDLLRTYDNLGKQEYPDGTALIGRAPHIAPFAWLHHIYATLSDEQIQQLEVALRMEIPEDYFAFLQVSNGLGAFHALNLHGYRSNYQRTVDAGQVHVAGKGAWIYLNID